MNTPAPAMSKALLNEVYGDLLTANYVNWGGGGLRIRGRLLSWRLETGSIYGLQFLPDRPRAGLVRVQGGFLMDSNSTLFKELTWEDTIHWEDTLGSLVSSSSTKQRVVQRLEADIRRHLLEFSEKIRQSAEKLTPGLYGRYDTTPRAEAEMRFSRVN